MNANNFPLAPQKGYQHEKGAEYASLQAWKKFTNASIDMLLDVLLDSTTGSAEQRLYGAATIGYDPDTINAIGAALGQIRSAIKDGNAHWLGQAGQTQSRLPAAHKDERFQFFLKSMSDTTGNKTDGSDSGNGGAA